MITVYFDTHFYASLARSNEKTSDDLLYRMNRLAIRGVCSDSILIELLTNSYEESFDPILIKRVSRLNHDSLHIHDGDWNVLLLKGEERRNLCAMLKISRAQRSLLNNFKPSVENPKIDHVDSFVASLEDTFKSMEIKNAKQLAHKKLFIENQRFVYQSLADVDYSGFKGLKSHLDSIAESVFNILDDHRFVFDSECSQNNTTENTLLSAGEQQRKDAFLREIMALMDVGYNKAQETWLKRVVGHHRDFDFVNHKNAIDFLQVTEGQIEVLRNPPKDQAPYLVQMGLADCCFYGENPNDSVDQIESIIQRNAL